MKLKLSAVLVCLTSLAAFAETEEQINKHFAIQSGGKLIVDVDFGSIQVSTNEGSEVVVDVLRRITRATKAQEEEFLAERPVVISQDGNTVTIHSRAKTRNSGPSRGPQRTEANYVITVPAQFAAQLRTAGGGVAVSGLTGDIKAGTSGGELTFKHLRGPLAGDTSGGAIRVADCEGTLQLKTSGGRIELDGGAGSFDGTTAGGPVTVKGFRGLTQFKTAGGDITVENVSGKIDGSTGGGSISARFSSPLTEEVKLATSGGAVNLHVPATSAFDLDAASAGGSVSSDLSVEAVGKPSRSRLKGSVNGGGKAVVLRTSGGNIQVRKL